MKKSLLMKTLLLLCALVVGSGAWAQSDYSALYTSNVTLSTDGGTSASTAKVKVTGDTEYDALKAGTGKIAGAVTITAPSGTKYLHLHVAAWNNESVTLSVTQGSTDVASISLTADAGVANNSPFTLSSPAKATTDYYKVITFATALAEDIKYTFSATTGRRFVVWGVNSEEEGSGGSTTYTVTYDGNGNTGGAVPTDDTEYSSGDVVTVLDNTGNLIKTGYSFECWNTAADGSGDDYVADATFTITANTTLYAQWILDPYTVTLGDDSSTLTEDFNGAGVTLPTRSGIGSYEFAGWSETNMASETTVAPTIIPAGDYTPAANITLYPVYSKTVGGGGTQNKSASVNIGTYATANGWENGTAYQPLNMDANISVGGTVSGNNFKYYTSDSSWRFYTDGSFTITANNDATLSSVTLTYSNGTLKYGETTLKSGTAFDVTGNSATISCTANAKITAISVDYTITGGGTTYYWSAPVAAAVEMPSIVVAENPFLFSTTATITCITEGAAIKYSYDGENWNNYEDALIITETKTIYAKAVKDEKESTVASVTATKNLATPTVAISGDLTVDLDGETNVDAGTLTAAVTYNDAAVVGAVVTWSSSNTTVATIDENTGAVTIKAPGTVTFTATYAANSDYAEATDTKTITVTDSKAPGSADKPYTVAQALAASPSAGVYVGGTISAITEVNTSYHNATYTITDGENTMTVYRGRYLNDTDFTNNSQIAVGDVVVVYGTLSVYNEKNQLAQGNYLTSLVRKVATPTFSPAAGAVAEGTEVTISTSTEGATIYYTTDGNEPTASSTKYTEPITINAAVTIKAIAVKDGTPDSDVATAAYTIAAPCATPTFSPAAGTYTEVQHVEISSTTEDATIYYTTDGTEPTTSSTVYSSAITVDEDMTIKAIAVKNGMANSAVAEAVYEINLPDYATLPFEYDGNATGVLPSGLTQVGLGTKTYANSPKIGFDTTADELVLKINEAASKLSFDIKGNNFSDGTFKVQTSVDGESFTDLETYTELGATQTETFALDVDIRYIKWIYTEKASGNVGLGNIKVTKDAADVVSITVSAAGLATFAIDSKLDFKNVKNLEAYIAKENGSKIELEKVNKVPAGTGVLLRALNSATDFVVPVTTAATDDVTGNLFKRGTGDAVESGSGPYNYVLGKHNGEVGFYKAGKMVVATDKAYLQTTVAAARIAFDFDDNETTGLSEELRIKNEESAAAWYDLQGRKVAQPTKGLYIVNGKKVVIK